MRIFLVTNFSVSTLLFFAPLTHAADLLPAHNPAGMSELPRVSPILPSIRLERQPLQGDMQQYERTLLKAEPLRMGALIEVAAMRPLMLDATRNQPISLTEALNMALYKNLSIKISNESEFYQKSQLFNYLSYIAPTLSSSYAVTASNINDGLTTTSANVFSNRLTFPLFTGGNYTQFVVAQACRVRGWRLASIATRNDTLLDVYKRYTNLVLNYQLLHIKLKAVELSRAQYAQEELFFKAGTSTRYSLLTAQSQLASSKQALLDQQVSTRKSAMQLAYSLDLPLSVNLVPDTFDLPDRQLVKGRPKIQHLLAIAYKNNPELKEYNYFRVAAARDIQIGMASYYPTVSAFLAYTRSFLSYQGSSSGLAGAAVSQISSGSFSNSSTSNTALGQTASLSPGDDSTSTSGANTGSSSVVASSGGTPMANIQSGSLVTSGSVAPSIISPVAITGGSFSNINGTNTASSGSSPGLYNTLQAGVNLNWTLPNGGVSTAANIVSLRALARQALLQANQKLMNVSESIRADYTNCLSSLATVESSSTTLDTNEEELRLAQLSLKAGNATMIDFEKAKSNYISGLSSEAQSIIALKQSEAQMLHDLGVISVDTLTNGITISQ